VAAEPQLSVVIPAFNEEARLPAALAGAIPYLEARKQAYELILVDDGSQDRTLELMREAQACHSSIKVVALGRNRGKGRALATGVAASSGEVILISDTDFSAPITELPSLEAALESGAMVAIASRAVKGARQVEQPPHRVVMGKIFNLAVQLLLLPGLWDTQCGFKLFRGDAGRELFGELATDGLAFDVEILYRARRRGWRIAEVPVHWVHSAPTRVAPFRHSAQMLRDVVQIRLSV
jgi:dolichyl-phosphate beta-glucosyltransferase